MTSKYVPPAEAQAQITELKAQLKVLREQASVIDVKILALGQDPARPVKLTRDLIVCVEGFNVEGVVGTEPERDQWEHGFVEGLFNYGSHTANVDGEVPMDLRAAYDAGFNTGRDVAQNLSIAPGHVYVHTPRGAHPMATLAREPGLLDAEWLANLQPGDYKKYIKETLGRGGDSMSAPGSDLAVELAEALGLKADQIAVYDGKGAKA